MTLPDLDHSVRQIRRRLFLLLMQAFGVVVLLTGVIFLGLVAVLISPETIRLGARMALGEPLRNYYLGRGSWEGVADALQTVSPDIDADYQRAWQDVLLLDRAGRVVIDHGLTDTPLVGQPYALRRGDQQVPLAVDGETIGMLVVTRLEMPLPVRFLAGLIVPIAIVSFFTGALTLLIGFLLARRVVTPLANVIGAAQAVAAGDLSARVPSALRGPDDLRSLSDSFNRMADTLERNDRERRDFLADIAHELRTPLTVLRGRLEGIVDGVYPADEAHVAPVLEETYVLERLVEDLRLLTLAESRRLQFDRQSIQLDDLAERAADLFRAEAEEKNIALAVHVPPAVPAVVADPQRVGQVLGNLLSNAIRYAPENGNVTIEVGPAAAVGRVQLLVRDNGPGVSEDDLPKIFDRFWRGEKSRTRSEGGAGLGLAIARQLIEAQGGSIRAINAAGGGLEVSFVL
jgi:two-component system OmpR family sensor kinase/two-component system sensor histidine kinase BaeS